MNRHLLDYTGPLPLPPGTYRFHYEWWEVWGPPKVGETATEYMRYVLNHGICHRIKEMQVEVEPD